MAQLSALLDGIIEINPIDLNITGLALDSRQVQPGDAFFACKGTDQDGRKFIQSAVQKGACVILAEKIDSEKYETSVPIYYLENLNHKISEIAARFYGNPANSLEIIGITGTNGKTSCSHFIADSLNQLHLPCGIIGTLGTGLYGDLKTTSLTTPDPITLQKIFAEFVAKGVKYVAMEVSSHSLDQGRVKNIPFAVGIFTNLTRDHLDYHHTMESYGAAKRKLFDNPLLKDVVINNDDEFGQTLLQTLPNKTNIFSYSLNNKAHIYAHDIQLDISGIKANVITPWGEGVLNVHLIGQFNLSNVLAVLATLCILKIPLVTVLTCLNALKPVPGRMQAIGGKSKPLVVVDYSHTPDSLEKALHALRLHCQGKLYCVFGCGGDRDRGKRPLMAKVAEQYADFVVVTDDNPRNEDPAQIVAEIIQGFSASNKVTIQHDRSKAIRDVIQYAEAGDCVLIAGKGAETYQQVGNTQIPFSDIEKVKENL